MRRTEKKRDSGKVYIGNLGNAADQAEISHVFKQFGPIQVLFVAKRPPGFAFVQYEDERDAWDAVDYMQGRQLCGRQVKVELSSGRSRWPGGRPPRHLLRKVAPRYVRSPPPSHDFPTSAKRRSGQVEKRSDARRLEKEKGKAVSDNVKSEGPQKDKTNTQINNKHRSPMSHRTPPKPCSNSNGSKGEKSKRWRERSSSSGMETIDSDSDPEPQGPRPDCTHAQDKALQTEH